MFRCDRVAQPFLRTLRPALPVALSFIALATISPGTGNAGDWPQFRGPTGQGHASDKGVPVEFDENSGVQWKTAIPGRGWSSPVVLDGQVWLTTAENDGKSLRAICVELKSGRIVHNVEVFTPDDPVSINAKNSHASPTPVIEPGRVYVHFGSMGTACLNTKTGAILWKTEDLKIDHKEGPGSSPILVDDTLVVHCDGRDQQYVVALDKLTGKQRWKTNRSAPLRADPELKKAYCTPLVIDFDGKRQLISPGPDQLQSYDPATGSELWRIRYIGFSNVPRPVFADGMVLFSIGYMKPEMWALRPDGTGDVTDSHVAWKFTRQAPANPSPLAVDGLLFFVSDAGVITCLEIDTGKQVWQQRVGGNYWASPILAEGRLYFCSEEGVVTVIKASRKYEVLASNKLDGSIFASPAVVDGTLLLRTNTHLYRFAGK